MDGRVRFGLSGGSAPTGWAGILPTLFVVLSLIALLVGPLIIQARVRALTDEIQSAADPARTGVTRIQYLLARQTSTLRGYLISGDPDYLRQFEELHRQEDAMYEVLRPLAARLGPEVIGRLVELRALSIGWHGDLREELLSLEAGIEPDEQVPFDREEYLAALEAAGGFDAAIARATLERQREIRDAEDRMATTQVGLVLLALFAAGTTAALGFRVRQSAMIAEERRREAERALEETAQAIHAKARLIRGVTHDVKNPLGAADGYAELLELGIRGPLTPEQAHMVTGIRRSIHSGLSIINDMLELAGAEGGSLAIKPSIVSLPVVVRECAEDYSGAADAAGHRLELRLPDRDVLVHTDPHRVKQILGNLLSNAIKYTPAGGTVTIEMEVSPSGPGTEVAIVHVSDTGRGIPPEYHERIFVEFERLPGAGAQGHGLGLAISRRISRLLGGDLSVHSDGTAGSRFSLSLPVVQVVPDQVPGST